MYPPGYIDVLLGGNIIYLLATEWRGIVLSALDKMCKEKVNLGFDRESVPRYCDCLSVFHTTVNSDAETGGPLNSYLVSCRLRHWECSIRRREAYVPFIERNIDGKRVWVPRGDTRILEA